MIEVVFTLDYEIYGNGTGALNELVYQPARRLRDLFQKHDSRFVCFTEAAEFEKIEAYGTDPAIDLVKKQIQEFHADGFEIGLHLHPQWANAHYEQGHWSLDLSEYDFCKLPKNRIVEIVDGSLEYLRHVVGDSRFTPLSFRAGNWLFQPTEAAASILAGKGIKVDSSVFKGGLQHNHNLDYRQAPKHRYYWPFSSDVMNPDPAGPWVEVPIYTQMVPFWRMPTSKRMAFGNRAGATDQSGRQKLNRALDFARFHYPLKFDFCRMTVDEMASMINGIIREDTVRPETYRPVVAIGHTKDLTDFDAVDSLLSFLKNRRIAISTFTAIYPKLASLTSSNDAATQVSRELQVTTGDKGSSTNRIDAGCTTGDTTRAPQSLFTPRDEWKGRPPGFTLGLVTPARNEAEFIEDTIKSVVAQSVRPARWVIVSDGSTDGTDGIVAAYAARHDWIELVRLPQRKERSFAGKVYAFNAGYARLAGLDYDVIGNLDADITLDQGHFGFLLEMFSKNPELGVAGTPFQEGNQRYDYRFTSLEHVSGACQLFRRECFEQIGGYTPIKTGGIDLVAVMTARMKGWQTRTFLEKHCVHHRQSQTGSAKHRTFKYAFKDGRSDYLLGCDPLWQFLRVMYRMKTHRPRASNGFCLAGYLWAMVTRAEKAVPKDLVRFRRAEERRRLRDIFMNALRWQTSEVSDQPTR